MRGFYSWFGFDLVLVFNVGLAVGSSLMLLIAVFGYGLRLLLELIFDFVASICLFYAFGVLLF